MKEFLVVLLCCVAVYTAKLPNKPKCAVSHWGSWGKCESNKMCKDQQIMKSLSKNFHLEPTKSDKGAAMMKIGRQRKAESFTKIQKCREDDTCMNVQRKQNNGAISCQNGYANEYPCDLVNQRSFINFETLSGGDRLAIQGNDVWGWTDPLNGDEYAIYCIYSGTSFIRMTDPENPVVVGYLPTRTDASNWRDAKVIGNHVYIVSEARNHGIQVFDLTQLRDSTGFQEVEASALYSEFGNCHNIVATPETNTVYCVGGTDTRGYPNVCDGGLHAVDVSDPLNPTFAGCYGDDGYVHDAQCLIYSGPDTEHQGKEICFCYNEDSLTIVDATDKDDFKMISKEGYLGSMYTHQGWVTEDQTLLLLDDELDEVYVTDKYTKTYLWDVSDLDTPNLVNTYKSSLESIDHNQYIKGNFTYQSNYKAGLRILYIDQENQDLEEVAYFDVNEEESADFAGSWSNYPYFQSGNIALGSIDYGFFVVTPDMSAINQKVESKMFGHQQRSRQVLHRGTKECPTLKQTISCKDTC